MALRTRHDRLFLAAAIVPVLVLLPIGGLVRLAAHGTGELWPHLISFVLPDALRQTAILLAGTALVSVTAGAGCAWLVTGFRFPGCRWLEWALVLPLAVPTYIVAYSYLDILHPVGPVQSVLRVVLGSRRDQDLGLPDIRSMGGCILVMGFALFPYVYVSARAALLVQSADAIEAARSLGATGRSLAGRITLPMALPSIGAGLGLVMLETLADIGATEFLGVRTMTVAVYVTWTTRGSVEGAAQISLAILVLAFALLACERSLAQRRDPGAAEGRSAFRIRISGLRGALAFLFCAIPVLLGFALPTLHLAVNAFLRVAEFGLPRALGAWAGTSFQLAALATAATLALGGLVAAHRRFSTGMVPRGISGMATLGYALPGTVLAVGLMAPVASVDEGLFRLLAWADWRSPALLLSGSLAVLILAYAIRFLAVPVGLLGAAYQQIPGSIDDAARALGAAQGALARKVHLPLLTPAATGAALLVFIECVKELPATLVLRPLNVETLATAIYAEASRGTYEDGGVAALAIVVLGLLPTLLLIRRIRIAPAPHVERRDALRIPGAGDGTRASYMPSARR